jgi:hypothetical protein
MCYHLRINYPMPAAQPNIVFTPADDFNSAEKPRPNGTAALPNTAALLVEGWCGRPKICWLR